MYLKYASKITRTAIILFYVLCLLYVLSAASFVSDLVSLLLEVSDNSICKNIFFFNQLCSGVSLHYRSNFKMTQGPS